MQITRFSCLMSAYSTIYSSVFVFHLSVGDRLQYEEGESPLHSLEQATVYYASAIRLSSKEARLHFLLGLVLEEQHYATEMYGLRRKVLSGRTGPYSKMLCVVWK